MNKGSSIRDKTRKAKPDDDVKIMEERLYLLKQQMLVEKQRRQELLQRNSNGSIWKTGGSGPLRDKKAVEQSVQKVRLEGLSRQSSGALDSENSRASTARKESPARVREDCQNNSVCTPDLPRRAEDSIDNSVEYMGQDSTLRPYPVIRPVTAASAEIQTEAEPAKKWEINVRPSNKRPQSAPRAPTYFEKVLEARRRLGEQRVPAV
jgi:hypothetical protein